VGKTELGFTMIGILAEVCETCGRGDMSGFRVWIYLFAFVSFSLILWAAVRVMKGE